MHEPAEQLGRRVPHAVPGAGALAAVNAWWTMFQSPWSFCVWNRTMRSAAANASARPSCSAVAPLGPSSVEQRVDHRIGVVGEELPPELVDRDVLIGQPTASPLPLHATRRASRSSARCTSAVEVVRVAPLAALLRAGCRRGLPHQGRQHGHRRAGADVAERFERLVREVDGVATVDEDVVGHRREHHPFDIFGVARRDRGGERTFGGVGRPRLDEAAVPLAETLGSTPSSSGSSANRGGCAARVARHEDEPVRERERAVGRRPGAAAGWPSRRAR